MNRYIVTTSREAYIVRNQPAKLCRSEGYKSRYIEVASGTVEQMEALADELNRGGEQ